MKSYCLLLILLGLAALSIQAQQFTLPAFKVTTDTPTCQTASSLLTTAQNELYSFQNFVNTSLPQAKALLQDALSLTRQACTKAQNLRVKTLLQVQGDSKSHPNIMIALQKLSKKMTSHGMEDDLYNMLIGDKIEEITSMMLQVSQASNVTAICNDLDQRLTTLSSYMDFLVTQITAQYINDFFPKRITYLNNFIADCNKPNTNTDPTPTPTPSTTNVFITETGSRSFQLAGDISTNTLATTRTKDFTVKFDKTFSSVPSVGVSVAGIQINKDAFNFRIDTSEVTTTNFKVTVIAGPNAAIQSITIGYIATLSDKSGIYITTHSTGQITSLSNPATGTQARDFTSVLTPPSNLANVQSMAYIRGATFGQKYNVRLTTFTSSDSKSVVYRTYQDSVFNSAATTIVFWSGSDASTTSQSPNSSFKGPLFTASGASESIPLNYASTYAKTPELFVGLYHVDLDASADYFFTQSWEKQSSSTTITMKSYSKVYELRDSVLLTCKSSNKSCLAKASY